MAGLRPPRYGEVWLTSLNPVIGHEQGGLRPCVVVSGDLYNRLPIAMAIVVPLTTRDRQLRHRVPVTSDTSGLDRVSYARPEDMWAISASRMTRRLGSVTNDELTAIGAVIRTFLDI